MRILIKITVTIIFLVVFIFLYGVVNTYRQQQGFHTAGPIGSFIVLGLFVGLFVIWKYIPSKKEKDEIVNKHKLDKD